VRRLRKVVRENNLNSIEEVTNYCKAGGGCQGCHREIQAIIDRITGQATAAATAATEPPAKRKLTNIEKMRLVEETIAREIRPALRADGGDIELVDIDRDDVTVALRGRCSTCRVSQFTLKGVVEQKLREHVSERIVVHQAEE